jgi:hypothetical protein
MGDGGEAEVRLRGGNVAGAVRVGDTVRRATGPWTPAVHALLDYLAARVPHVPRVLGRDDRGREVLTYLPGQVIDPQTQSASARQIASVVSWTRAFHAAVAGFSHPGPWRYFPVPGATLIGHNDIAPYNVCFDGEQVAGVFDWDLAGPSTPLLELAFIAWNFVPLWRPDDAAHAAKRLQVIAAAYGGPDAHSILRAVPPRIQAMLDWIVRAAAHGDEGMANLMADGEPGRSARSLAGLRTRMGDIERCLSK